MAIQKTQAFVLKTQPLRSSSLIATFFSKDFGKLRGVVKGVRREGEWRGAAFEPFTLLEIIFYEKSHSDLHLVSEAFILDSHDALRRRLESIAYASYFSEIVDEVCQVHDPHERIFELLDFGFRFLPSLPGDTVASIFEVKLLHEIGWLPYLDGCVRCRDAGFAKGFFSVREGCLICAKCVPGYPDARPVSPGALGALRFYIAHGKEESLHHGISGAVAVEIRNLLGQFLNFRLPNPLKTRQFMKSIHAGFKI